MTNRKKNIAVVTSFIFIAVMLVIFALLIIVRDSKKSKEIVPEVTTEASTESEAVDNYIPVVKRKRLSVETRIANTVIRVSMFKNYIPSEDDTEDVEGEVGCEGINCHIVDVTDPDFVPKEGYNYIPSEIAEPAECEGVEVIYYEIPAEY